MARPKRKASVAGIASSASSAPAPKKGRSNSGKEVTLTAAAARPRRDSAESPVVSKVTRSKSDTQSKGKAPKSKKASKTKKSLTPAAEPSEALVGAGSRRSSNVSVEIPKRHDAKSEDEVEPVGEEKGGPSYWLMKAEPESRIEKGKEVKFSIDDLKDATTPEGWDGVRNLAARNNMRAMKEGDLAFFYHSNCKVPGIAGTMEIVEEYTVDESAFDPDHPYYDSKSSRENPKWSLVHVGFRQKFPKFVKLKELQKYAKSGGVLEHLQTLKQSRLSVSKVSKKEWDFIMSLVDDEDPTEAVQVPGEKVASKQLASQAIVTVAGESNAKQEEGPHAGEQS